MAAYAKENILYISVGFWLILGAETFTDLANIVLTVQTGGSVTIPCHYDKKYTQQKKFWYSEIDQSNKYTNTTEENLSVIDHPDQSLFTVTMRNLQEKHTGRAYCVVETGGKGTIIYEFYLKVQYARAVFVMSSSVYGHEGGNVCVQCFYGSEYQIKLKRWCRYKDESCFPEEKTDRSQNSSVQISDDGESSFTVLMTGLRLSDSGWYFCTAGDHIFPVQLTVSTAESENEATLCNTKDINEQLSPVWFLAFALVVLGSLILVGVFFWIWRRRPKQDKHQLKESNDSRTTDEISTKPDDLAVYCSINDETPYSTSPLDPNKNMTYSTIDYIPGSEAKGPAGGDVYSTVGPH